MSNFVKVNIDLSSCFYSYLENKHILHCRPDTLGGGGLSGLPVDFVYYNGTATKSMKTTKKLPIPDERGKFPTILNGSKSYEFILGYFTTKELHPDEVHQLGLKMLDRLYPQVMAWLLVLEAILAILRLLKQ